MCGGAGNGCSAVGAAMVKDVGALAVAVAATGGRVGIDGAGGIDDAGSIVEIAIAILVVAESGIAFVEMHNRWMEPIPHNTNWPPANVINLLISFQKQRNRDRGNSRAQARDSLGWGNPGYGYGSVMEHMIRYVWPLLRPSRSDMPRFQPVTTTFSTPRLIIQ